jgi:hypothetical protein
MSDELSSIVVLCVLIAGFAVVFGALKLFDRYGTGAADGFAGAILTPGRILLWLLGIWPPNVRVYLATALTLTTLYLAHDARRSDSSLWMIWLVLALATTLLAGIASLDRRRRQTPLLTQTMYSREPLEAMLRRTRLVVITIPIVVTAIAFVLFTARVFFG